MHILRGRRSVPYDSKRTQLSIKRLGMDSPVSQNAFERVDSQSLLVYLCRLAGIRRRPCCPRQRLWKTCRSSSFLWGKELICENDQVVASAQSR